MKTAQDEMKFLCQFPSQLHPCCILYFFSWTVLTKYSIYLFKLSYSSLIFLLFSHYNISSFLQDIVGVASDLCEWYKVSSDGSLVLYSATAARWSTFRVFHHPIFVCFCIKKQKQTFLFYTKSKFHPIKKYIFVPWMDDSKLRPSNFQSFYSSWQSNNILSY